MRVYAVGCSTAHGHGVRVLQLRLLEISLCRRRLRFHVSAAASTLPSRGIYVVANEKVRGVPTPLKRAERVIKGQGRDDMGSCYYSSAEYGNDQL
jgi:hypothetical protein